MTDIYLKKVFMRSQQQEEKEYLRFKVITKNAKSQSLRGLAPDKRVKVQKNTTSVKDIIRRELKESKGDLHTKGERRLFSELSKIDLVLPSYCK